MSPAAQWRFPAEALDILRRFGAVARAPALLGLLLGLRRCERQLPVDVLTQFPEELRWSSLARQQRGLTASLAAAAHHIESLDPVLQGTLTHFDLEAEVPGDDAQRDACLAQLLRLIDEQPGDDEGEVFDALLERAAAGRDGAFITPLFIADLLAGLLAPQPGMRICDPVCGVGRTLLQCERRIRREGAGSGQTSSVLHGQEKQPNLAALCRLNLLLHGVSHGRIEEGDVLREPRLIDAEGQLLRYDRVVADPPVGARDWGTEQAERDPFGRFFLVPPKQSVDAAFLLHCLAILKEGGRAVMLASRGLLIRGGVELEIRRRLLEEGQLAAVIGLPSGVLYGTGIAPMILVLERLPGRVRDPAVFLLEMPRPVGRPGRQASLSPLPLEKAHALVETFQQRRQGPHSRLVPLAEIAANDWNLSLGRYLSLREESARASLTSVRDALRAAERDRDEAAARVDVAVSRLISRLGLSVEPIE